MSIKINPQAKYVYLSTDQGWTKVVAHIVEIDSIKYSFVPATEGGLHFIVSELYSGSKVTKCPINTLQYLMCDTKESFLEFLEKTAKRLQPVFKQHKKVIEEETARMVKELENKFGPMPEITDCDDIGVIE